MIHFAACMIAMMGCTNVPRTSLTAPDSLDQRYVVAMDYIKRSLRTEEFLRGVDIVQVDNGIKVSNQVVFIPYYYFGEEIFSEDYALDSISYEDERLISIWDSLSAVDENRRFETYEDENMHALSESSDSNLIVFFSRPYNNTLAAELYVNLLGQDDYEAVSHTNKSLSFLFKFEDASIDRVYVTTLDHN